MQNSGDRALNELEKVALENQLHKGESESKGGPGERGCRIDF